MSRKVTKRFIVVNVPLFLSLASLAYSSLGYAHFPPAHTKNKIRKECPPHLSHHSRKYAGKIVLLMPYNIYTEDDVKS